jgi:hypothetical protein
MRRLVRLFMVTPLLFASACDWLPGPMDAKCDEHQVRDIAAPGGKVKAVERHSVCEGNAYVATIEIAGTSGSDRATAMHAQLVARTAPPAWPELKVEWKSDKELWITYPAGVDVTCVSSPPGVAVHCLDASIAR